MKFHPPVLRLGTAALFMTAIVLSCTKDFSDQTAAVAPEASAAVQAPAVVDLQARALAANCFQCHGTNGYAPELGIAGMDAVELVAKLKQFQADGARENIMNVHALAYTDEQLQLLGAFFQQQQ